MRQTLFAQARIELAKTVGDRAWLKIWLNIFNRLLRSLVFFIVRLSFPLLSTWFPMQTGDVYNQKLMRKRLNEDEDAVSNLYMDNGYLFYQLIPIRA